MWLCLHLIVISGRSFSQVLMDQLTQSRMMTFDPVLPQQGRACGLTPVVLLLKRQLPSPLNLQVSHRAVDQ